MIFFVISLPSKFGPILNSSRTVNLLPLLNFSSNKKIFFEIKCKCDRFVLICIFSYPNLHYRHIFQPIFYIFNYFVYQSYIQVIDDNQWITIAKSILVDTTFHQWSIKFWTQITNAIIRVPTLKLFRSLEARTPGCLH